MGHTSLPEARLQYAFRRDSSRTYLWLQDNIAHDFKLYRQFVKESQMFRRPGLEKSSSRASHRVMSSRGCPDLQSVLHHGCWLAACIRKAREVSPGLCAFICCFSSGILSDFFRTVHVYLVRFLHLQVLMNLAVIRLSNQGIAILREFLQ